MNIGDWSDENLCRFGEYDAVATGDRTWTSGQLHHSSGRLAGRLADIGVVPGDRVLLLLPASAEMFVASTAVWRAGAVAVIGSASSPAPEIDRIISHCEPSAILASAPNGFSLTGSTGTVRCRILVGGEPTAEGWLSFEELISGDDSMFPSRPRSAGDAAQIIYTSGTSGAPKGVVYTHGGVNSYLRYLTGLRKLSPAASVGPVVHSLPPGSFGGMMLTSRFAGDRKFVVLDGFDPERVLSAIEIHRATSVVLVPTMCEALLAHTGRAYDCSSLRTFVVGGAHVSASLSDRILERFGLRPAVTYGTTEAGGGISADAVGRKPGSVGRTQPSVRVRIVDDQGNVLQRGKIGEIQTQSPWSAQSYYLDSEATTGSFRDGWVRTADLGYLDGDGDLFIVGRRDEMIIQGGVNIYPQELADLILRLPFVRECAVVGISDPFFGEEAVACVVLHAGAACSEAEILSHCGKYLDRRKIPARVQYFDALPRTENGKTHTAALRERLSHEKQATVCPETVRHIRGTPPSRQGAAVEALVERELARELGITGDGGALAVPDRTATFGDCGLTSLGAVRFTEGLSRIFGCPIDATLTFRYPTIADLSRHILDRVTNVPADREAGESRRNAASPEPVAIIGVACRLPGGVETPRMFWELLQSGADTTTEWPRKRGPGGSGMRGRALHASYLQQADLFDADFFELGSVASDVDPQQRVLLEVAWEALEDAGCNPRSMTSTRAGVFLAISANGYRSRDGLGVAPSMATARLCHFLDVKGPAVCIDTSCSSSLAAVHYAAQSLLLGEIDIAIAGGVNIIAEPSSFRALQQAGVLSADGRSKTFDAGADGYGRGEGCVVIVLKRLSDASAGDDRIHANIRGSAMNHDGRSTSLTAPNPAAQERVIREALQRAAVAPPDVQYVEAHGTGTLLGDPIEAQALTAVFGAGPERVPTGSVKTNIGHLEPAAGVAGLLKTVLAIEHRQIPASRHFQTPNPHIPWNATSLFVQTKPGPWPRPQRNLIACVSSFGMSGTNVHVVLEEATGRPASSISDPDITRLLPVSARTPEALEQAANRYIAFLDQHHEGPPAISDIAYTASFGRAHLEHRIAVTGRSAREWAERLRTRLNPARPPASRRSAGVPRIAVVFSGQGSQWWGMGRELYEKEPVFRRAMDTCAAHIDRYASWKLLHELARDESTSRLEETGIAQPALFALQSALFSLWSSWGVEGDSVVGHSAGEIAAAYAAGALDPDAAALLAVERGRLMQRSAWQGKTFSVELGGAEARTLLADFPGVQIAAVNAPTLTTISGPVQAIDKAVEYLSAAGVRCRCVSARFGFHSNQFTDSAAELKDRLRPLKVATPRLRMISSMTGSAIEYADADYWSDQVCQPVRFYEALRTVIEDGCNVFVEIGPHPVLISAIEGTLAECGIEGTVVSSLRRGEPERETLLESLCSIYEAGVAVDWAKQFSIPGRVVDLPTYPWQHKSYWLQTRRQAAGHGITPLIHRYMQPVDEPAKHLFESDIDLSDPEFAFFGGDRAPGETWLPAAAFLELICQAVTHAFGTGISAFQKVEFGQGLPPDLDACLVQTILTAESASTARFAVLSRACGQGSQSARHVQGSICLKQNLDRAPDMTTFPSLRDRCKGPLESEAYLLDCTELYGGNGEVLGKLSATRRAIHPAFLNPGLARIAGNPTGAAWMPARIDELNLRRPGAQLVWLHASAATEGERELTLNLCAFDEDGRVVAEGKGITFRASDGHQQRPSKDTRLYDIVWKPAPPGLGASANGLWLLLTDRGGVGQKLQNRLERAGAQVMPVRAGSSFAGDAAGLTLDPEQPEHFNRLFAHAFRNGQPVAIVHLWSLDIPSAGVITATDLEEANRTGCLALIHLIQALTSGSFPDTPKLFLVTRGVQPVGGHADSVAQAPVWGFGASLRHEYPELPTTLIDLDPRDTGADDLFAELTHSDSEDRIAIRGANRWVARLVARPAISKSARRCRPDRTYLITGGLGGLGLVAARRLVELGARYLALVGRSEPGEAALTRIRDMEQLGARIVIVRADVADAAALESALFALESRLPPPAGVVHAAGVLDDGLIANLSAERVRRVLAPKIPGAWNLHLWSRSRSLDFFVMFSSMAGITGSAGQAHYAAANAFLDGLAHARKAMGLPATSIDWGGWRETGMAARAWGPGIHRSAGFLLSNSEGADLFESLLADGDTVQVCATAHLPPTGRAPGLSSLPPLLRDLMPVSAFAGRKRTIREELIEAPTGRRARALEDYLCNAIARLRPHYGKEIRPEDSFQNLGLDSLHMMTIRRIIQTELHLAPPGALLVEKCRIGELTDWMAGRLANAERATPPSSPLVEIRSTGARPPLTLVHPAGGSVSCYHALGSMPGRRMQAFEMAGLDQAALAFEPIEQMAERYLKLLLAAQPDGSFLIGGWSFGGCVAFEMAKRLRERGKDVPLLILIDSHHPNASDNAEDRARLRRALFGRTPVPAGPGNRDRRIGEFEDYSLAVRLFLEGAISGNDAGRESRTRVRNAVEPAVSLACERGWSQQLAEAIRSAEIAGGADSEHIRRIIDIHLFNLQALRQYRPGAYDGPVLLIGAAAVNSDPGRGWRDIAQDLRIEHVDGDHFSIMRQPAVARVAEILTAHIDTKVFSNTGASA